MRLIRECLQRAASAALLGLLAPLAVAQTQASLDQGLFTEEQVRRGAAAYSSDCVACHASDLRGNSNSPGLVGLGFLFLWEGRPLSELFMQMRQTMPSDRPAALPEQTYIDLLAFLLDSNGFPAGAAPLTAEIANSGILISSPAN